MLAAEYVLGVLPADERRIASAPHRRGRRVSRALSTAGKVHLSPLAAAYPEVEPPASVKVAIDRRLFATAAATPRRRRAGLWSSLAFWRGLAAAAVAALAIYIAVPYVNPPVELPQTRLVASLAADGSDVSYLAVYDAAHREVGAVACLRRARRRQGLRAVDDRGQERAGLDGRHPGRCDRAYRPSRRQRSRSSRQGAVLAVSLEPTGGSPTGQPTGPVVAAGDLKSI